ncbi:hypothetical protein HPB48_015199 [Haemaphysalis longicornis]|uniref:HTH CENPB-type domain-containing protein n=1 Tax=Haemaphysalis longicornis TaxID=44386 RepID=A0A9J6F9C4_HAELO|nr:hypothetical protein HPB48_015199 [Haemaphysalis longicornis]
MWVEITTSVQLCWRRSLSRTSSQANRANYAKRLRKVTYADVEDALLKWFVDARASNLPISGPMMLRKARDFAFMLDFPDFCPGNGWQHRFKRLVIAIDRPAANWPLGVSLYSAVEMVKAAWSEVAATFMQNCFRKVGLVDTQPESEPDASDVIDSDMEGHDLGWADFVCADEDADTALLCTDEGIVNEVRGKSVTEESDADDGETSEPARISAPIAMGYVEDLFTPRVSVKSTRVL